MITLTNLFGDLKETFSDDSKIGHFAEPGGIFPLPRLRPGTFASSDCSPKKQGKGGFTESAAAADGRPPWRKYPHDDRMIPLNFRTF